MSSLFSSPNQFPEKDLKNQLIKLRATKHDNYYDINIQSQRWSELATGFSLLATNLYQQQPVNFSETTRDLLLELDLIVFENAYPGHIKQLAIPFFGEDKYQHERIQKLSTNIKSIQNLVAEEEYLENQNQRDSLLKGITKQFKKIIYQYGAMQAFRQAHTEHNELIAKLRTTASKKNISTNFGFIRLTHFGIGLIYTIQSLSDGPSNLRVLAWSSILAAYYKAGEATIAMLRDHIHGIANINSLNSTRLKIGGENYLERDLRKLYIGIIEESIRFTKSFLGKRKQLIEVDHYISLYLNSGKSAAGNEAMSFLQSRQGGCYCPIPYPTWKKRESRIAVRQAQNTVIAGRSESYSFVKLAQETKHLPDGTEPLLTRFAEEVCDEVRKIYISSNNHPPGRGWVFASPNLGKLFFKKNHENTPNLTNFKRANRNWIGNQLEYFDQSIYLFLRGVKGVINESESYQIEGEHYSYLVFNDHFSGTYDGAWLFPTEIVKDRLSKSLYTTSGNLLTNSVDLLENKFTCAELLQECHDQQRSALNLSWISTLFGGCAYAFPVMSEPNFVFERFEQNTIWKDVNGHIHLSYIVWNFQNDRNRVDAALKPYQELGKNVYKVARAYQRLLALFNNRYAAWKCDQTPGEIKSPKMLQEVYKWYKLTQDRPLAERPVLCLMPRGQANMINIPLIDCATLEIIVEDSRVPLPKTSDGTENQEISLWRKYVVPWLLDLDNPNKEGQYELCLLAREHVKFS